jgi:biopolymer transport protein ExbB
MSDPFAHAWLGEVLLAAEVTTGQAFIQKLIQGGWTMVFLLLVSIGGLAFTVERFVNLRRGNIAPKGLAAKADQLWREGHTKQLAESVEGDKSTLGRMIAEIVEYRRRGPAFVQEMAGDVAARDLRRHLQKAYPLAVVATISPLLGLLGTIIGMIGAFDAVATAGSMGDASILGGDISKALITTGAGLAIAIPALALYHYFKVRTGIFAIELEEIAGELVADWYDENGVAVYQTEQGEGQKAEVRPTPTPSKPTVTPEPTPA